jgi:hypothetical protein
MLKEVEIDPEVAIKKRTSSLLSNTPPPNIILLLEMELHLISRFNHSYIAIYNLIPLLIFLIKKAATDPIYPKRSLVLATFLKIQSKIKNNIIYIFDSIS